MVRVFVTGAAGAPDQPTVLVPVPDPLRRGYRVNAFSGFVADNAAPQEQAGRMPSYALPTRIVDRPGGELAAMVNGSQGVPRRRSKKVADRYRSVPNGRVRSSRPLVQGALGVLALTASIVGLWQLVAPRSFFDAFPGFDHAWVRLDGPYN